MKNTALEHRCANAGTISNPVTVTLDDQRSYTVSDVPCTSSEICVVPETSHIDVVGLLNVGALVVKGSVSISTTATLCAGYISIEDSGTFTVRVPSSNDQVYVYVKDNGLEKFGTKRFLRGSGSSLISIEGSTLARTWSLLSETALSGSNTIKLMHDPSAMGWQIGDRVVIAPMLPRSSGNADACSILNIANNQLTLDCTLNHDRVFTSYFEEDSQAMGLLSAEVIHLTRNVVITGDDQTLENCIGRTDVNPGVTTCTYGLHTMSTGVGSFKLSYTRVEKCGQRGILGKYCAHLHLMQNCPTCLIRGNAFEHGHQRAVVVHGP